jgi:hypothetical protein
VSTDHDSLGSQLAKLFPDLKDHYTTCARKTRYTSLSDASRVALKRRESTGTELYCYHCEHCDGWHLSHRQQTAEQIARLDAFSATQRRGCELELRTLWRTIRELESKMGVITAQFKRFTGTGIEGIPLPSRIRERYDRLRQLNTELHQLRMRQLTVAFEHDSRVTVMMTCRDYPAPCAAWREATERKIDELRATIDAAMDIVTQEYTDMQQALADYEAKDLEEFRQFLNARYSTHC